MYFSSFRKEVRNGVEFTLGQFMGSILFQDQVRASSTQSGRLFENTAVILPCHLAKAMIIICMRRFSFAQFEVKEVSKKFDKGARSACTSQFVAVDNFALVQVLHQCGFASPRPNLPPLRQ